MTHAFMKMFYKNLTRISWNPNIHMMSEAVRSSVNISGLNVAFSSLAILRTREFVTHSSLFHYSYHFNILNNRMFTVNFGDE
jgi:hypothetical protein